MDIRFNICLNMLLVESILSCNLSMFVWVIEMITIVIFLKNFMLCFETDASNSSGHHPI